MSCAGACDRLKCTGIPDYPQTLEILEDDAESPESLDTLEPCKDPYSSDGNNSEKPKRIRRKTPKHVEQEEISSLSHLTGIQLKQYLNFTFQGVNPEVTDTDNATVVELLTEAFTFMYPDGPPKQIYHSQEFDFHSVEVFSWPKICGIMWEKFVKKKHINWLYERFNFDYSDMTVEQYYRIDDILWNAQTEMFIGSDNRQEKDDRVLQAVALSLKLHSLFYYLEDAPLDGKQDKELRLTRDKVKSAIYGMINFVTLWAEIDGAYRLEFYHPGIGGRSELMSLHPDVILSIPVSKSISYPYAVIQIYGPLSEAEWSEMSSSESNMDSSTTAGDDHRGENDDSDDNRDDVRQKCAETTTAFNNLSINVDSLIYPDDNHDENKDENDLRVICSKTTASLNVTSHSKSVHTSKTSSNSIHNDNFRECNVNKSDFKVNKKMNKEDFEVNKLCIKEEIQKVTSNSGEKRLQNDNPNEILRTELRKEITQASPIDPEQNKLAFRHSTGQLPLEMYGLLVCQGKEIPVVSFPGDRIPCQGLGIFVLNEFVYLEKIVQDSRFVHQLVSQTCGDKTFGPAVYLSKWKFDLKKPNHRSAFLAFLYCYREVIAFEKLLCNRLRGNAKAS